ncbi:MAG: hypothetical protein ACKVPJ_08820 [Chitinophagales bacterium]
MKSKFLVAFLCITSYAKASDSLVLQIEVATSFFTTDHLENIYYITVENEIVKYEWQTKETFTFSNKQLGKPSYIDVSNPLKVLVLYPDFNTIAWLDNTLSSIQLLKLNQLPDDKDYLVTTVCAGQQDNVFWIFDQLSNKLISLDERGNTLFASEAFTDMFFNPYIPQQLLFENNTVYVKCTSNEILLFDVFANYVSAMDIESEGFLQITEKNFLYVKSGMLFITQGSLYNTTYYKLPAEDVLQAQISGDKLFLRTGKYVSVYTTHY